MTRDATIPETIGYIIIGGGISGLSLAYWLLKSNPETRIILVCSDRATLKPASVLNAGFLTVGSLHFFSQLVETVGEPTASEILEFCRANHNLLESEGILSGCQSYYRGGSYSLSSDQDLKANPLFHQKHQSIAQVKDTEASWHCAQDGSVDPSELVAQLQSRIQTDIKSDTATEIFYDHVKLSSGLTLKASKVIVASNAWIPDLLKEQAITPTRAQALLTSPLARARPCNYYFSDEKAYVRIRKDMRLAAGGMRHLDRKSESTSELGLNPLIQESLSQLIKQRFSNDLIIEKQWSGIMGFTKNHLPIAGQQDGVYFMGGFSGHGMGMAFHLAKRMCHWLLDQQPIPHWTTTNCNN